MRIDLLFNKLCLTKTRSIAKNACDKGLIHLNSKEAKASAAVQDGDLIRFCLYGYEHELRITKVPTGNVSKKDAHQYYEMLHKRAIDPVD